MPSPSANTKYVDVNISDPIVRSPTGDYRTGRDARQQLRAQLTSPIDGDVSQESNEDDSLGELATQVRNRLSLSRSNSLVSQIPSGRTSTSRPTSLPGSKVPLVSDTRTIDLEAAISILQELRKNASPEDLAALHKALLPPKAPEPTPAPSRGSVHRKELASESSHALIRRRSLATPGLATRGSPTDALRKPCGQQEPSLKDLKEHEWKLEMMGTSPLTRLATLDLAGDGRNSPTPRAQTPGDMAYSHLGSLQLGSLVVTNGAASPTPSVMSKKVNHRKSTPDLSQEEDYFTASEGCGSPTALKQERVTRSHFHSQSAVLPASSPLSRECRRPDREKKSKQTQRSGSPLKRETLAEDGDAHTSDRRSIKSRGHAKTISAPSVAQDYMAEIASSPFADREEFSEGCNAGAGSSGVSRMLDVGIGEPYSEYSMDFREEAFRILDGTIFGRDSTTDHESHPARPQTSEALESDFKNGRPSHSKADSGYSSGASLRALQREGKAIEEGTVPSLPKKTSVLADLQKSGNGPNADETRSLYTFEQMLSLSVSQKPLPPPPDNEDVKSETPRLSLLQTKSWKRTPSTRTSNLSAPNSPISVSSSHSTDSRKSSMHKRLQKRRPTSQQLPTVQTCQPIRDGSIPSIPDNIRVHFTRRLSETPGMDHLTRTYASTAHTESTESLIEPKTDIFPIRFPSPATSGVSQRWHFRSQSARPPTPPPHHHRPSLFYFRSEKLVESESVDHSGGESVCIADFGTVAQSLGRSPYDVATSALHTMPVTSPTYPHQFSTALPRVKSMVSMDSATASEFARMRSRERAAPSRLIIQRPRSYHEYNLEAGEATAARASHPRSVYSDVPPVPSITSCRLSLARASSSQATTDLGISQPPAKGSDCPKIASRETSVSALIEKFNEQPIQPSQEVQPDWEAHSRLWRQRRKLIGERLRHQTALTADVQPKISSQSSQSSVASSRHTLSRGTTPPHAKPTELVKSSTPTDVATAEYSIFDRYSGGLDYGYEHGFGVGGSTGTRHPRSAASRKSMHFSNQFGVDLSDVPILLQRTS